MTLDDIADLARELAVLRAQLAEEKSRRKRAEDAWAGMCELLGQRLEVKEDRLTADMPIGRKVTATLMVDERVFLEKKACGWTVWL